MPTTHPVAVTFEHILVPTDFSDVSRRALEYAKTIAKPGNSELLLAHVSTGANLITSPEAAWIDAVGIEGLEEQELEQSGAALRSERLSGPHNLTPWTALRSAPFRDQRI